MLVSAFEEWASAAAEFGFPVCTVESSSGDFNSSHSPQAIDDISIPRSGSVLSKSPPVGEAELEAELRDFLGSRTPSPEVSISPTLTHVGNKAKGGNK